MYEVRASTYVIFLKNTQKRPTYFFQAMLGGDLD